MAESPQQPMTPLHRTVLQKCRMQLVEDLDVSSILGQLIQEDVLKLHMQEVINAQETRAKRVERFLDILPTRGDHAFFEFQKALDTDYPFLVEILQDCQRELDAEVSLHYIDRASADVLRTANIKQKQPKGDDDEDDYEPVIYRGWSLNDDDEGYTRFLGGETGGPSQGTIRPPPPRNEPVPFVLLRDSVVKGFKRQMYFDGSVKYVDPTSLQPNGVDTAPETECNGSTSEAGIHEAVVKNNEAEENGGSRDIGVGARSGDIGDIMEKEDVAECSADVDKDAQKKKKTKSENRRNGEQHEPAHRDDEDCVGSKGGGENVQGRDVREDDVSQLSTSTDVSAVHEEDKQPSVSEAEEDCVDGPRTFARCPPRSRCSDISLPRRPAPKPPLLDDIYENAASPGSVKHTTYVKLSRGDLVFLDPEGKHTDSEVMVHDIYSRCFLVFKHYISRYGDPNDESWYYPLHINSQHATMILSQLNVQGCFLVYKPMSMTAKQAYNISVCSENKGVTHYHIYQYNIGEFSLKSNEITFPTVQGLVDYHKHNRGALCCRLRCPPNELQKKMQGLDEEDKLPTILYESISVPQDIEWMLLGSGRFSRVFQAEYNGSQVAIKIPDQSNDSPWTLVDFPEESKILSQLDHPNIVKYVGFVAHPNPLLVTEMVPMGNLKQYLIKRQKEKEVQGDIEEVNLQASFEMCYQLVCALKYIHSKSYILHRDIAARNILLASEERIKLCDFGMARYVVDDKYKGENGELLAVRWAAPEVMTSLTYSTASDIWAAGVVFWEIFSDGRDPYSDKSSVEVTRYVVEKNKLFRPLRCPMAIYRTMMTCWHFEAKERPTPEDLGDMLQQKSFYKHVDESLELEARQVESKQKKKSILNKLFQSPATKSKKRHSTFHVAP